MDEASGHRERRHLHFDFQSQRIAVGCLNPVSERI